MLRDLVRWSAVVSPPLFQLSGDPRFGKSFSPINIDGYLVAAAGRCRAAPRVSG